MMGPIVLVQRLCLRLCSVAAMSTPNDVYIQFNDLTRQNVKSVMVLPRTSENNLTDAVRALLCLF